MNSERETSNACPRVDTYGAPYSDGTISQGGYSSHMRAHEYFTFKIPDNIESEIAAPMVGVSRALPSVESLADKNGKSCALV